MSGLDAVDTFAGGGGWSVGARSIGLRTLGIERDRPACDTRRAAGLLTVEGDVRRYGPGTDVFDLITLMADGHISSPPCPSFSMSGKGTGRQEIGEVLAAIKQLETREDPDLTVFSDDRTALTLEPLRWLLGAYDLGRPFQWVALEQVPSVLPIWEATADVLRREGYHAATGLLRAEDFGIPQRRSRAVLIAHRNRPVTLPVGTSPVVTMHDALGWGYTDKPAPAVTAGGFKTGGWEPFANARIRAELGRRPTVAEAAILQSFPEDYPWQGTKGQQGGQVGNAVPPVLARVILQAVAV